MSDIRRIYASQTISIAAGSSLSSTPIDMRRVIDGNLEIPAALTAANFGFKVSSASNGNPLPLYDHAGNIVEIIGASVNVAYAFPSELYGSHWVWLWSQSASGTNVDQSASRSFNVQLKS